MRLGRPIVPLASRQRAHRRTQQQTDEPTASIDTVTVASTGFDALSLLVPSFISSHMSQGEGSPLQAPDNPYDLSQAELYWRDRYTWILEQGYQLRPRYNPEKIEDRKQFLSAKGDSQSPSTGFFMDATRVEDNMHILLKRLPRGGHVQPPEVSIMEYFSLDQSLASNPRNHCVPLLACLNPPKDRGHVIIVMPVLRPYDQPDFDTVGEGVEFIRQMIEGFAFLHHHRVAHRDIRSENVMMDGNGIYTEKWSPWYREYKSDLGGRISPRYTRTERPPKYYIIDFGFSRRFREEEMPPSIVPKQATDLTVPEYKRPDTPCDPFPIDVYTLGNLIRTDFMDGNPDNDTQKGRRGFEFLRPLVSAMTKEETRDRPTMEQAVGMLDEILKDLSVATLRSRAVRVPGGDVAEPTLPQKAHQSLAYWVHRISYVVRSIPPLPIPPAKRSAAATTKHKILYKDSAQ